jgi:hypothetical protein
MGVEERAAVAIQEEAALSKMRFLCFHPQKTGPTAAQGG